MKPRQLIGIALLALGALALVYRGFTYTKSTTEADFGPLELTLNERERVSVPVWAGIIAIVAGGGLLLAPARKS